MSQRITRVPDSAGKFGQTKIPFRAIFAAALLIAATAAAALISLRSAQRLDARGREAGFSQPIFGAADLQLGVNAAFDADDA